VKFDGCYPRPRRRLSREGGLRCGNAGPARQPGCAAALASLTLTAPFNDARAVADLFREHAGQIAAIIVEPYVGMSGSSVRTRLSSALRDLCDQFGALLIFDE